MVKHETADRIGSMCGKDTRLQKQNSCQIKEKTDNENQPKEPKTKFGKLRAVLVVMKVKMNMHKFQYFNDPKQEKKNFATKKETIKKTSLIADVHELSVLKQSQYTATLVSAGVADLGKVNLSRRAMQMEVVELKVLF